MLWREKISCTISVAEFGWNKIRNIFSNFKSGDKHSRNFNNKLSSAFRPSEGKKKNENTAFPPKGKKPAIS